MLFPPAEADNNNNNNNNNNNGGGGGAEERVAVDNKRSAAIARRAVRQTMLSLFSSRADPLMLTAHPAVRALLPDMSIW